jgi:hypothetical protein
MRRTLLLAVALPLALALSGGDRGASDADRAPVGADATVAEPARTGAAAADAIISAPPVSEGDALSTPLGSVGTPVGGADGTLLDDRTSATDATEQQSAATSAATAPSTTAGLLVAGTAPPVGQGPLVRYSLQLDPMLGFTLEEVAATVSAALLDDRSWSRTHTIERVADPAQAQIRIVIASPEAVDALCATAGLDTAGIFSCWNGRVAALNGWRWEVGARGFDDLETYRTYLVNHEFGHGLGYGHVGCPAAGALAPVMMQQSKTVAPCVANGWPFPG